MVHFVVHRESKLVSVAGFGEACQGARPLDFAGYLGFNRGREWQRRAYQSQGVTWVRDTCR